VNGRVPPSRLKLTAAVTLAAGVGLLAAAFLSPPGLALGLAALGGACVGVCALWFAFAHALQRRDEGTAPAGAEWAPQTRGGALSLGTGLEAYLLTLLRRPAFVLDEALTVADSNAPARDFLQALWSPGFALEALGSQELCGAARGVLAAPGAEMAVATSVSLGQGEAVPVRGEGISFRDGSGRARVFLVLTDLRPDRVLSARDEHARELDLIGQSVASSAHEIKNLLMAFEGGSSLVQMGLERQRFGMVEKGWHMVEKNLALLGHLVHDILALARESPLEFAPARLDHAALDAVKECKVLAREAGVELVAVPVPEATPFPFSRKAVVQCAVNLAANAVEACADLPAGRVRRVEVGTGVTGEGFPFLSVSDTGPGIPADALPGILAGFKTTKGSGGTGLGLLVVQKIMKAHGGRLQVACEAGKGATFTLLFAKPGP
jgi:signal transduction histidine kinase